jgi:hypothetical protein
MGSTLDTLTKQWGRSKPGQATAEFSAREKKLCLPLRHPFLLWEEFGEQSVGYSTLLRDF